METIPDVFCYVYLHLYVFSYVYQFFEFLIHGDKRQTTEVSYNSRFPGYATVFF